MRTITGTNREANEAPGMGIHDYWMIVRRKMPLVLQTVMAFSIIVGLVVYRLPNLYRAETMILVDPQQVPNNYVASTVSTSINDRLSTIHQEVTSPSRLKRLIDSMNLYADTRKTQSEEEVIAGMQKAITVQVVEQGGRGLSAFRVGFSGRNPEEVAAVTNQLAELFISENLKARERQSNGTAQFLDDELRRTKDELNQKQGELNDVKSKYMQDLPESKQYHLEALTGLRSQLQSSQDRVSQDQQQKVYLQSMASVQAPTADLDPPGVAQSQYAAQKQKLEAQLSALKAHYGDKHPEVRKLQADLADIQAKEKAALAQGSDSVLPPHIQEAGSDKRGKIGNPVLTAQIEKLDQEVEKEQARQQDLQSQIAFHVGKLEKIPSFEQRISGMMWDYDTLRAHYAELESKKLAADMASALEIHEKGERFVVLDRAVVPSHPYSPKRGWIILGGVLAGLATGIGLAVAVELSQGVLYSKSEVAAVIEDVPILAEIPTIHKRGEVLMKRVHIAGAFLATGLLSIAIGLLVSHYVPLA